jgi:voltage-gated potassium channel
MRATIASLTSGQKYDAYAKRFDGLMLVLAGLFLFIWSYDSLDADFSPRIDVALKIARAAIWVVFGADLVIRVVIAKSSWRFILQHPLDVLAVVIPPLRPLKILTVFTTGTRMVTRAGLVKSGEAVVASAALLIWVGAVAEFNYEHKAAGAVIKHFGDSLWWAVTTITTVGYGDFYPVTPGGRIVAAGLMFSGIALLGVVTASVAAWFVRLTSAESEGKVLAVERRQATDEHRIAARVDSLEAKIDRLLEREEGPQR